MRNQKALIFISDGHIEHTSNQKRTRKSEKWGSRESHGLLQPEICLPAVDDGKTPWPNCVSFLFLSLDLRMAA
jgi:hypothetical protein